MGVQDSIINVIQVVGTVAKVVTLIFVYRQTRLLRVQTEELSKNVRSNTYQNLISGITELNTIAVQDTARAYSRVKKLDDESAEEFQERWIVYTLLAHYENIYILYELGVILDEIWIAWKDLISFDLALLTFRRIAIAEPYYSSFKSYFGLPALLKVEKSMIVFLLDEMVN